MFSFCFSYPYGLLITIGGLMGYLKKGSKMSLIMGLLFGGITMALAYSAHQKWKINASDRMEILGGIVLSVILTLVMSIRWSKSGKFMPSGMVALLSICMTMFYAYRLMYPNLPKALKFREQ